MNTFLPFFNIKLCVEILDNKRLNKQILECYQLINGQWKNHPCSKMWINNLNVLKVYFNEALKEWKHRDKNHKFDYYLISEPLIYPSWWNNKLVELSHKVNLLRKNYNYYSQFFVINNLNEFPEGYFWPLEKSKLGKISLNHSENWLKFCSQMEIF